MSCSCVTQKGIIRYKHIAYISRLTKGEVIFCLNVFPFSFVLSHKVLLVTGAGSGIGRCLAAKFATKGAKLALWDINQAYSELMSF